MFIDSRELKEGQNITAEICIIGGGAAGITLAKQLSRTNIGVCLLESGGIEFDWNTQTLYSGKNDGDAYEDLDKCRLRFFGGSTNHWGGWTRPLDPIDFTARSYGSLEGWPISEKELKPYYEQTDQMLQLGDHSFDSEYWEEQTRKTPPLETSDLRSCIYRISPPTRFAASYGNDIRDSKTTWCCLYANAVEIQFKNNKTTANKVIARTLKGNGFSVTANVIILATGGIENARLMLSSNKQHSKGIGNQHDLVGRYFADHVGVFGGFLAMSNPGIDTSQYMPHTPFLRTGISPHKIATAITLRPDEIESKELPNFSAFITPSNFSAATNEERKNAEALSTPVSTLITRHHSATAYGSAEMALSTSTPELRQVIINAEPFPEYSSRITLSTDKDPLGMPRSKLHWKNHHTTAEKLRQITFTLAKHVGAHNLGRIHMPEEYAWPPSWQELGRHHMGTTRMSQHPQKGVVDQNCRVHGTNNLYVAGSSIFPTYGYAQPTYNIVVMALRLAEHLISTRAVWRGIS